MPGKNPPLRHDAEGAAPPIPADEADRRSPRSPAVARLPTKPLPMPADVRLEHRHRSADAVPRVGRRSPIPHYALSPDPKTRTTANPAVT